MLILETSRIPAWTTIEGFLNVLLRDQSARPELLVISEQEDIEGRLQAMRAGAQGYYPAPVPVGDLAQKVIQIGGISGVNRHRILLVEDDAAQAKYVAALLTNAGMDARVLGEPLKVLDTIRSFHPDLILMDLYMPEASGAELTAIIREQDDCFDIPIVFLSSERDVDKQMEALRLGGDSFIAKPVQRKHLLDCIEHRIGMARWLNERRFAINRRDAASGMLQKDPFMRHLDRSIRNGGVLGQGCGLLLIEIDSPRQILDRLGIQGTERLLRAIEVQLSGHMTPEECAARMGDFSYALLARRENRERLDELAEKLCAAVARTSVQVDEQPVRPTASIGIGLYSPPADDAVTMISRGQKAAMAARIEGGNRVRPWLPSFLPGQSGASNELTRSLIEDAIRYNGLLLLFQPIVSVAQEAGELYEAQLRLRTGDGELVPPAVFLPVAEQYGLMPAIDRWVMKHAMDVMDLQRLMHPRLRLLVHQSVASVAAPHWIPWFRDQIVQRNLMRLRPMVELQMREVFGQIDLVRPLMASLRKYGIQVCIANVSGTPAELELLSELSASLVKLSFSVLTNLEQQELAEVVRTLRDMGTAVIAAGIEDPETIGRVWSCRPDFIQGHHLQMPSAELSFDFSQANYL